MPVIFHPQEEEGTPSSQIVQVVEKEGHKLHKLLPPKSSSRNKLKIQADWAFLVSLQQLRARSRKSGWVL